MALSIVKPPFQSRFSSNGLTEVIFDITLDTSYPAGGYVISPNKIGLKTIFGMRVIGYGGAGSLITSVQWSHSTKKLMAQQEVANQLAEASNGANLVAVTVRVQFTGI